MFDFNLNLGAEFLASLYLDFDGVVNAPHPQHKMVKKFSIEIEGSQHLAPVNYITYSPIVVERLESFRKTYNVELVWGTTWNHSNHVLKLASDLKGLDNGRVLPAVLHTAQVGRREWTQWKADAIIVDQLKNPRPFIWVDDNAHQFHGTAVESQVSAPSLFVTPNSTFGLTLNDLDKMETFLQHI